MNYSWKAILSQSVILTKANLKTRYRNSFAGYLWVIISPLMTYMVQGYVFKMIFKIPMDNYFLFLLFGLIPWLFFSQTLEMVTTCFHYNGRLLKSTPVHPASLILAQGWDNIINSFLVMTLVLGLLSLSGEVPWSKIYLYPLPYISLLVSTVALGFWLSSLHARFFDVKFVLSFCLNILFFLTPVIYPENYVPAGFKFLLYGNPVYYLLRPWRALLESGPSPIFWLSLAQSFTLALMSVILATYYWRKKRNAIYLRL
jgi:ABC-type polysaccharide/polyol phosphate export permease